jgi:D-alanyl-D-alanine carboxypeptidase (penicillin-binding protein 5/6)
VKRRALLAVVVVLAVLAAPVLAQGPESASADSGVRETLWASSDDSDLRVDAAAWYLVGEDGIVLAQESSRRPRAIASITKLMTTIVALEHARPSDVVTVPPEAAAIGGSTIFLQGGEALTVAELVRGTLIPSANDAATALALHVGGGSTAHFVSLMNAKAAELGLTDTSFTNPHGLDEPGHLSSARDAALLVRHALGIPLLREALSQTSFTAPGGRDFPATDDLNASWPPLLGAKTGHTQAAGWSEAGAARARGATVYGAVLGGESRAARNEALRTLLGYGLERYRRIAAVDSTRVYATAETGYGQPDVDLVAVRTLPGTVHESTSLVERVVAPVAVGLPVRKGQRFGRVEVWDGDRLLASSNLVAAEDVSEPGLLRKSAWFVERTAANLWDVVS